MTRRYSARHALVLGKLYPLHVGHQALIRAAQTAAERVTVLVVGSATESIPVATRVGWVREEHPQVRVVGAEDEHEIDYGSESAWQHHVGLMQSLLAPHAAVDGPVDLVASSDGYGEELARRLGARWLCVDPGRQATPVSGTAIRADLAGHWWALPPAVRATLVRRVVVTGAESTGTTTLAADLAEALGTIWVPEFGRTWTELRPGGIHAPWHPAEFDLVAACQARDEDAAARHTPVPVLVCDTDVLTTTVWHERYVGTPSPTVAALAAARVPDLYLLTGDEIPFVDDGMRDGEAIRPWMQGRFRQVLAGQPAPWVELRGSREQRLAAAVEQVRALHASGSGLGPSLEEQQRSRDAASSAAR
ncbi:MAG TPA: AAA family ATPase [Dermatophilaceae bacterium]|nr:AAA family ATPase [Dermatophilaceae bacterium]